MQPVISSSARGQEVVCAFCQTAVLTLGRMNNLRRLIRLSSRMIASVCWHAPAGVSKQLLTIHVHSIRMPQLRFAEVDAVLAHVRRWC